MTVEASDKDVQCKPHRVPTRGQLSACLVDRRTRAWKRRSELVKAYVDALGGPGAVDMVEHSRIEGAAELRVVAELARARLIAGENISLDDIVRTENAARRAERSLNLPGLKTDSGDGEPPELDMHSSRLLSLLTRKEGANGAA